MVLGVHGFLRYLEKIKGCGRRMSWRGDYFSHLCMVLPPEQLCEIQGKLRLEV